MERMRMLCVLHAFLFISVGCAPDEDKERITPRIEEIRDASETGMELPIHEPVKWAGNTSGLLFAEDSTDTYSFCSNLFHPAFDMNVAWTSENGDRGTPIYAPADGIVVDVRRDPDEWGALTIEHRYNGEVFFTSYGHNLTVEVHLGDVVRKGQQIGNVGKAGTRYAHLHFEVRVPEHVCHRAVVENENCYRMYGREKTMRPAMFFGCTELRNRSGVLSWYRNPVEFVASHAMDSRVRDVGGASFTGPSSVPTDPAFRAEDPVAKRRNPSTEVGSNLQWCRPHSDDEYLNCLMRVYHPADWFSMPAYLVYPLMDGAGRAYWVRTGFGEEWYRRLSSPIPTERGSCGMPIDDEYADCSPARLAFEIGHECHRSRQDFQRCYMIWDGREPSTIEVHPYPSGYGPGAYENAWVPRATIRPRVPSGPDVYSQDDAAYLFAEAFERNGAGRRLGTPTEQVHVLAGTSYHIQAFSGAEEWGPLLLLYAPSRSVFISAGVTYGDLVQAVVLRTGFLAWYAAYDGIRRYGIPVADEYWDTRLGMARLDLESGNCLVWRNDPGDGHVLCGTISGAACMNYEGNRNSCPPTSFVIPPVPAPSIDLGIPSLSGGSEAGGGGGDVECDADRDGYLNATCGGVDCDDGHADAYPGAVELCNGTDDDCDGLVDEGGVCAPVSMDAGTDAGPPPTPDAGLDAGSGLRTVRVRFCPGVDGSLTSGLPDRHDMPPYRYAILGCGDHTFSGIAPGTYRINAEYPTAPTTWECNEWPAGSIWLRHGTPEVWVDGVPAPITCSHDPTISGGIGGNFFLEVR